VKYTYIVGQSVPSIGNSITEKKFAPIGLDRFWNNVYGSRWHHVRMRAGWTGAHVTLLTSTRATRLTLSRSTVWANRCATARSASDITRASKTSTTRTSVLRSPPSMPVYFSGFWIWGVSVESQGERGVNIY